MGEALEAVKVVSTFALIGILTVGIGVGKLNPAEMTVQNALNVAPNGIVSPEMIVAPKGSAMPRRNTVSKTMVRHPVKKMATSLPTDPQEMLEYLRNMNVLNGGGNQTSISEVSQQLTESIIPSPSAEKISVTQKKLRTFLQGSELEGLETAICSASVKYGVDPYFIVAVAVHESNWGKSRIAHDKNNLFGLNAVDSDPYNQAFSFPTKEDSVFFFAQLISIQYANMTIENVGRIYATDGNWANEVILFMNKAKTI
jgi:hypothetical protein